MAENKQMTRFQKNAVKRISSPEHVADYLRVVNPGIWVMLGAVILLLAGIFVWASVGTLETAVPVTIVVEDGSATVIPSGAEPLTEGMPVRIDAQEYRITAAGTDEFGRVFGMADISLPDGKYKGTVVTDRVHPIEFILGSEGNA